LSDGVMPMRLPLLEHLLQIDSQSDHEEQEEQSICRKWSMRRGLRTPAQASRSNPESATRYARINGRSEHEKDCQQPGGPECKLASH